ncbi:hypothetical protein AN1V17_39670 [Vallitalea sediminicola]
MIKDIIPFHKENRNCYEDVVVTICKWYQRNYEYMYKNSWTFYYEPIQTHKKTNFGQRLNYNNSQFSLLTEYSGIGINHHVCEDLDKGIIDIIIKLKTNIPIALSNMDMFWLPWTASYQNTHGRHTFIVIGYDDCTSSFLCIDPYYQLTNLRLSIKDFKESSSGNYISFYIAGDEKKIKDINLIINRAAAKLLAEKKVGNAFNNMRKFADEIEIYYDAQQEIEGYKDFFSVPIYMKLQEIGRGRKQFTELLRFLADRSCNKKDLLTYSDNLNLMGKKWDSLKVLFGKESILSNYTLVKKRAPNKIRQIADFEEKIAREIQDSTYI